MKVKGKISCAGKSFSLGRNEEKELPDDVAKDLIKAGFAEAVNKTEKQTATKKTAKRTPEDQQ